MDLVLYNTLTGQKEPFTPIETGHVRLYVCGPTVYDHSHIGHARAALVFDVLVRHLEILGYRVTYVRNFTDLDDKIINRSREEGIDFLALANRYIESYHQDLDSLGARRPDREPRATEFIPLMIEDIQALVAAGHAYRTGGDVYYDVTSFAGYGRLSGRNIEDMQAGARVEVDERKHHPLDFALWKESKPGEPWWESPWGQGRPGWHIECSAMSNHILGREFDIHGGGHDLVFPHHENEIAQSAALGRGFARLWMHNGFVRVDHQKMSKSLKNFFTVKEVLARFRPEVLRLFLLAKQYRGPIDFSDEGLHETHRGLERVYRALHGVDELLGRTAGTEPGPETADLRAAFREAMNDDLNTAKALGHLFEAVRELNRLLDEGRTGVLHQAPMRSWRAAILEMGHTLGILEDDPARWLQAGQTPGTTVTAEDPSTAEIEAMILARTEARARKDWAEADRIRNELKTKGVLLEDVKGQTRWRRD